MNIPADKKDRLTTILQVYDFNLKYFSNILGFHVVIDSIIMMAKLMVTATKSTVVPFYDCPSSARKSTATSRYIISKKKRGVIILRIVILFTTSEVNMVL